MDNSFINFGQLNGDALALPPPCGWRLCPRICGRILSRFTAGRSPPLILSAGAGSWWRFAAADLRSCCLLCCCRCAGRIVSALLLQPSALLFALLLSLALFCFCLTLCRIPPGVWCRPVLLPLPGSCRPSSWCRISCSRGAGVLIPGARVFFPGGSPLHAAQISGACC